MGAEDVVGRIRRQAAERSLRLTLHAHQEMVQESIAIEEVLEALAGCELLEEYPDDRRGPSCLVLGYTALERPLHMVCTTQQPVLILITVYEPVPPKWPSPTQRMPIA
jgi:hypothetical protein